MPFTPEQLELAEHYNLRFPGFSSMEVVQQLAHMEEVEETVSGATAADLLRIDFWSGYAPELSFLPLVEMAYVEAVADLLVEYRRCEDLLKEITAVNAVEHTPDSRVLLNIVVGQMMYIRYIESARLAHARKLCLETAEQIPA